jgi:tRNA (guanine-N7-)-methyltransferase
MIKGTAPALNSPGPMDLVSQAVPLVLDLGCGNGSFLARLAADQPGWNFLGVEKKDYRVRQSRRRTLDLPNAQVWHGEATEALQEVPLGRVVRAYLLFNDPWPKRRHAVRRLVQSSFLELLASRLQSDGCVFFASDSEEYFVWAQEVFTLGRWTLSRWVVEPDQPQSEFERRFATEGIPLWRFQARPTRLRADESSQANL